MSAAAGTYNIIIDQGGEFRRTITYTDSDGNLVDLSAYSAEATGRDGYDGSEIFNITSAGGGIILGGALGTIVLLLDAAATAAMDAGRGVWDLHLTDGSGNIIKLLRGTVTVRAGVTT